jgi:hypothetical protein
MKAPGMIRLFLCVSIDAVKRTEKFSGQMLALLLISHAATSVADVHILSVICSWWHTAHTSTFHKLQHCIKWSFKCPSSHTDCWSVHKAMQREHASAVLLITMHFGNHIYVYIHILLTVKLNSSVWKLFLFGFASGRSITLKHLISSTAFS